MTQEYAEQLGDLSKFEDKDIISAIESIYSEPSGIYVVELDDIEVGIDSDVFHMASGTILEWLDASDICTKLNFNGGSFFDRHGNREEF